MLPVVQHESQVKMSVDVHLVLSPFFLLFTVPAIRAFADMCHLDH